ncbi:MAG: hypothetical protein J6Q32_03905 [Clostridia bacterium]|nr:hypothetical protein [Clostridia bacterium]
MKRKLVKILTCLISAVIMLGAFTACGGSSWSGSKNTLKDGGAVVESVQQGFITETEKYVYFINGIATSTNKNDFGAPVKGSLMVADKNDLTTSEIVVPKLFAASDYNSGMFIDDGYVYYGTPSTHKTSSGEVANTELAFMRTKLDASGKTEELFIAPSISTEYRIAKSGNDVYIVYHDSTESAIYAYNATTKKTITIAKNDPKVNGETLTSGAVKFLEPNENGIILVYATTTYLDEYNEKNENLSGYTRPEALYNKVYAYKVGDGETAEGSNLYGSLILNGNVSASMLKKYAFSNVKGEYLFYTETDNATSQSKTFAIAYDKLLNDAKSNSVEITRADVLSTTAIVKGLNEVYYLAEGYFKKISLTKPTAFDVTLAYAEAANAIVLVEGNYIYYSNADGKLSRISIVGEEEDRVEEIISESTFANSWYKPEIINGKIFYCDNSSTGSAYIKYVDIANPDYKTEEDEDGNEITYIRGSEFMGKLLDEDVANIFEAKLEAISTELNSKSELEWEIVEGVFTIKALDNIKEEYAELTPKQIKLIEETSATKYANLLKAGEISEKMYAFYRFDKLTETEKDALKADFESLKAELDTMKEKDFNTYKSVRDYVENNLKYYFYEVASNYSFN